MKQTLMTVAAAVCISLMGQAHAQTSRVAYVDIDRVTEKSEKINKEMGSLREKVEGLQADIDAKLKKVTELKADVRKNDGVIAESEISKKKSEISKLEGDIKDLQAEGEREMKKLNESLFDPMVKVIGRVIQDVAKEKNIDLVLRGEVVLYSNNVADITEDVVKKLNSGNYSDSTGSAASASSSSSSRSNDEASSKSTEEKSGADTTTKSEAVTEKKPDTSSTAKPEAGEAKKPIFPTVPLRAVDRQSE